MKYLLAFLVAIVLGYASQTAFALPPPRPEQPHPDIFQAAGFSNLQDLNPLTTKIRAQRTVSYRLLTMPGCSAGTIPADMATLEVETQKLQLTFVHNDAAYDLTIRINCGSEQIRICGAVNIFCLGRGFPYDVDVEISDILSLYLPTTRLAILLHEIAGHAFGTWNEQYCMGTEATGICRGLTLFASAPGWHDFMNTGPDSRQGLQDIELERWSRTMYNVLLECSSLGFDPCTGRFFQPDGWSYNPPNSDWYNPFGQAEFSACNRDGLRYNYIIQRWTVPTSNFFDPVKNYWARSPEC